MPITRSAKKRMRQNVRRRQRNRMRRSTLRSAVKSLLQAIESGDVDAVQRAWPRTQSIIDLTARRGMIHRNTAARTKARLARRIQSLSS